MFDINQHINQFLDHSFFEDLTYRDLKRDILSAVAQLKATNEEYIALKMRSPYNSFVLTLALLQLKKIPVLLSPFESDHFIKRLSEQVDFKKVLTDDDLVKISSQEDSLLALEERTIASIVFSSGSSSLPKGVALSFNNIYYSALGFIEYFKQTAHDVSVINLPHYHVSGLMILWRAFFSGSSLTQSLQKKVDFLSLVPLQLSRMMNDPNDVLKLKSIRALLIGGAPLPASLKVKAEGLGLKLFETYGMTESSSQVLINGEVLPYREVSLDETQTFIIGGKTLAMGYFKEKKFHPFGSQFKTSDQGEKTADGKFRFVKRQDLIFISGGENINPLLVEELLKELPEIKEAYLVSLSDLRWGEMGILLYEGSLDPLAIKTFLKEKLHPYWVPKFIFKTPLSSNFQIKPKRSELKLKARELYLKSIFHYQHIKKDEALPWLIFFHGFLGNHQDLMDLTTDIKDDFNLLFLDLPGHGKTKSEHFYDTEDCFIKLKDFIELFSIAPYFYGYSMGGRIALHLALHLMTPKKLFLESAGFGLLNESEKKLRLKNDLELLKDKKASDTPAFLEHWYQAAMFAPYYNSERFSDDCQNKFQHDPKEWQQALNLFSTGLFPVFSETMMALQSISSEVVYLYGELDLKYKEQAHRLSSLKLANLKVVEISDGGHNPHKTHLTEIKAFLRDLLK